MATKAALCIAMFLLSVVSLQTGQLLAQDWPSDEPVQEAEQISGLQTDSAQSSEMPISGRSLRDSVLLNSRNKAGFSLGLFGLYDRSDLGSGSQSAYDSFEMMVMPAVFVNLGRRKAVFHADYSLEQRFFNEAEDIGDSTFHTGNFALFYTPTRHWTITATDEVRSAPSNLLSLSGGLSPGLPMENLVGPGVSGYSYERLFMNSGAANFAYEINRKTSVSFYGNSQVFRYETDEDSDTDAYNVGASINRRLGRRFNATSSFMFGRYENVSGLRNDEIKRVSGGLGYQINRNWRLFGNGGVEWVDSPEFSNNPAYFSAALGRITDFSIFSAAYTKSAQYQLGTPQLNDSHTISVSLDQRLSSKSSLVLATHFYRSKPYFMLLGESATQNTLIAGAGFKHLLTDYIMMSANGNYQHQDRAFNIADSTSLKHLVIYAGIELIFPNVSRR